MDLLSHLHHKEEHLTNLHQVVMAEMDVVGHLLTVPDRLLADVELD